ncbi:MAG: hypothetical protein ACLR6B_11595 [Blautia sp.]
MEGTSIFAVFQADPYDDGLGSLYNRIAFGGAKIVKVKPVLSESRVTTAVF